MLNGSVGMMAVLLALDAGTGPLLLNESLWMMALLLFLEGGTLSFLTTPTLLYYGRYHEPWAVALIGSTSSAAGSALQLLVLRWAISSRHPWMQRFTPSRERIEAAVRQYPSASFMALLVARATPLPDAPLKIVAAVVEYPVLLYTLAVLLGALPYFYLLAMIGHEFRLPNWVVLTALALIVLGFVVDRLRLRARTKS